MASLLESPGEMINPDTIGSLGKSLGADSYAISSALGAAGPLLLGGMATRLSRRSQRSSRRARSRLVLLFARTRPARW
jgi:hypothetical protein